MENAGIVNELLLPFRFEGLIWTTYSMTNLVMAVFCTVGLGLALHNKIHRMARPALIMALLSMLSFQWPLAVFSSILEKYLPLYWFFAFSVHCQIIACIMWVVLTPGLTEKMKVFSKSENSSSRSISVKSYCILFGLITAFTAVYLSRVHLQCTGLYAAIVDPELTLLARELSGKLIGTGIASYGFGLLINVICPLLIFLSLERIKYNYADRRFEKIILWIISGIAVLLVAMLSGSKGTLIPAIIVISISSMANGRRWWSRVLISTCIISFGFVAMTAFELLRERKAYHGKAYEYGVCAARMNLCPEAKTLLDSMRQHDMSLGVSLSRQRRLSSELDRDCSSETSKLNHSRLDGRPLKVDFNFVSFIPQFGLQRSNIRSHVDSGKSVSITTTGADQSPVINRSIPIITRVWHYTKSIVYRAAVVPLQVASWYFLYATEYGAPGIKALPMANKFSGSRVIMPKRIHEVYYPIYSHGDRTASGTSPTSFIMAYPAYLGYSGIVLSLAALFSFDLLVSLLMNRMSVTLCWAFIGLVTVGCINFMLSDFGTTLLSHGTAFALLLMWVLSIIEKKTYSTAA